MFVTFEGLDGSGKTTQIRLLAEVLRQSGHSVITTREPGGTRIGNGIRQVLLDIQHTEMHAHTETLLFNAARAQLIEEVVRPALAAGRFVLCDRFADSTLAYQGFGHEQDLSDLRRLIRYATGGLAPDLTLYLDLPPEEGLRRKQGGAEGEWNRLDAQELDFYRRVAAGYQQLIREEPNRWVRINGMQPLGMVQQAVVAAVETRLVAHVRERSAGPMPLPEPVGQNPGNTGRLRAKNKAENSQ